MKTKTIITLFIVTALGFNSCSEEDKFEPEGLNCSPDQLFDLAKGECVDNTQIPTCDDGLLYDPTKGECVDNTQIPTCDDGLLYDPSKGKCVDSPQSPSCDDGLLYDPASGECVSAPTIQCAEDEVFDTDKNRCRPKCDGQQYDPDANTCVCPGGQEYNEENQMCLPKCDEGMVFNTETNECIPATLPQCAENEVYDTDRNRCRPTCDGQQYDPDANTCVCPDGQEYNEENKICLPKCDEGMFFNTETNECVPEPTAHCSDGFHLNEATGACEETLCPLGSYLKDDQCIKVCNCGKIDNDNHKCIDADFLKGLSKSDKHQLALRETAMAYFRRGNNIQYELERRSEYFTPEMATPQHLEYTVCNSFVLSVYYQALGIILPENNGNMNKIGQAGKEDVVYHNHITDFSPENYETNQSTIENGLKEAIGKVKPGDILSYYVKYNDDTSKPHAVYFYDVIKNDKNAMDGIIIHSTSNPEAQDYRTTKLDKSLCWNNAQSDDSKFSNYPDFFDKFPELKGITQGTIQLTSYSSIVSSIKKKITKTAVEYEASILRPAANDTKYQRYINKHSDTTQMISYKMPEAAICRIHYPSIEIIKTVDVHAGSTVEPGDKLTYQIEIKNNGNATYPNKQMNRDYENIYVTERLSEYVTLNDEMKITLCSAKEKCAQYKDALFSRLCTTGDTCKTADAIGWLIPSIKMGEKLNIEYSVTVKDNAPRGTAIHSEGQVASIDSAPIDNIVEYHLSENEVSALSNEFKSISTKGKSYGLDAIEQAYKQALGYQLDLKSLSLGALYLKSESTVIKRFADIIPFLYSATQYYNNDSSALLVSLYGEGYKDFLINQNHPLYGMVLNHYYSGVYTKYTQKKLSLEKAKCTGANQVYDSACYELKYSNIKQKPFEHSAYHLTNLAEGEKPGPEHAKGLRTDRENMIYPETLRDGDILIYSIANDIKTKIKDAEPNGTYAYLFLDGKFQGLRKDKKEIDIITVKNAEVPKYYQTKGQFNMLQRFGDMPKMFGKDFYVVLRPSLTMKKSK